MDHSFAVWSLEDVTISILSSEKFMLVMAWEWACISLSCLPSVESQIMTVPSSKIETSVSSKGPHFTFVAFMGSWSSMESSLFAGSNCQTMMRFGTSPSDELLNLSLHVQTLFWAPGFWFHSTYLRMPPWLICATVSPVNLKKTSLPSALAITTYWLSIVTSTAKTAADFSPGMLGLYVPTLSHVSVRIRHTSPSFAQVMKKSPS
mmetsp:Transcript_41199/g.116613  ORF Transcript_41199/g.116613 Transcript_41199/m.116613 type:complete len:205 (+) Transcript_41199:661-1275(+)